LFLRGFFEQQLVEISCGFECCAFVRDNRAFIDAIDTRVDSFANLMGRGRLSELRQASRELKRTVIFRMQPETVSAKHAGQIEAIIRNAADKMKEL
jgi:hypothetical protein